MDTAIPAATDTTGPTNPTTGRAYKGGNIPQLVLAAAMSGYPTGEWAGYTQWAAAGRQVRKGETCTAITYMVKVRDRKSGAEKLRPKTLRVFNIAQTQLVEAAIAA